MLGVMLVLDLRWLLFYLLLSLTSAVLLSVWMDRRRRKRESPLLNQEGIRSVLDQAPFGWLILDSPDTYRCANPYARRLLGLTASFGPLPEEEWAFLIDDDRALVRREAPSVGRYRSVTLPSDKIAHWWITPCGDVDFVFLLDITVQRHAEEAARYLLSGMSHELRTPLGAILAHLEILLFPAVSAEIKEQSLRLMKAEVKRMARLVNLMLELGRLETSAEMEHLPVDILALVEQVLAYTAPQADEQGITLSIQADTPLPPVVGDADLLMQVFFNLLDNVLKHCRPGDQAEVSLRQVKDGIECTVRDTGPGIPVEHLPHVTRRFYRAAHEEIEGSGLGLALVEEILRRHGSHLEIESDSEGEETGTSVRFVLPILPEEKM